MKCLNVRDFPEDLRIRLRIEAATRNVTLRELVIEYLEEGLKKRKAKKKGG